jgi:hypothetical protein
MEGLVSGLFPRKGGILFAGAFALLLGAVGARADDSCDSCFAFFRRCPPESGIQTGAVARALHLCRPPRCPPYCDPNFGYYPTAWRSWPSTYVASADELPATPGSKAMPGVPPSDKVPPVMPPATDAETRRRQGINGGIPSVRAPGQLPTLSGASER